MGVVQIPLKKVPSQKVVAVLNGQRCVIVLREVAGRQFFNLSVNEEIICSSVLLVDNSRVVRISYKNFTGEFMCVDTQGDLPPEYTGWGDRWQLLFNSDV